MKLALILASLLVVLSACASQAPAPVVDRSVKAEQPVVHSRTGCEYIGGTAKTSNKCR